VRATGSVIAIAAALLLAACGGSGEGLDENGRPLGEAPPPDDGGSGDGGGDQGGGDQSGGSDELQPTIESIQAHIFTPRCTECHAGAAAPEGLQLTDAQTSYSMLVGVRSQEYPLLFRVQAGNADNSYIIHKLEGTQEVGARMPRGGPYLDQDTINVVRQWIDDGAPPPAQSSFNGFLLESTP